MKTLLVIALALLSTAMPAQVPDDVSLEPVPGITGLSAPLGLKHAGDGSGRIFIVQQGERQPDDSVEDASVQVVDSNGDLLPTPFIDVSSLVTSGGERGLLDIAFHPEYASAGADGEGKFYLHFSSGGPADVPDTARGDTVVAEFSVTANPNVANNAPERIVLTVSQDFSNHNGGQMRFGTDGYLYLGLGDGGSGNDPCNRGQTLDPDLIETSGACRDDPSVALLGKMLRIDVDNTTPAGANNLCAAGDDGSANYAVPPDNPFLAMDNRCGEVLHYGLRNPWRWSFDRTTGDMWIGDVGQNTWEEIDLLPSPTAAAENFGWKLCEGSFESGSTTDACQLVGSILPVLQYRTQSPNCSVTGGYRYRGPVISLQGIYIYGDFCSGNIWFANNDSGAWQTTLTGFDEGTLRSFGEDEDGNVYVIAGGGLFRFEGDTDFIFADGFEAPDQL